MSNGFRKRAWAMPLLAALVVLGAPAAAHAQKKGTGDAGERVDTVAAPRPRAGWLSDRRELGPGDAVTVLLDEYTLASADGASSASRSRNSDGGVKVSQNVVHTVTLPTSAGASYGVDRNVESEEHGQSSRRNRFQGEITARVTGTGRGGMLRIEGTKRIQIEKGWQEMTLSGWVRPADLGAGNTVQGLKVADLSLVLASHGDLGKPKQGILTRVLGVVWP